MYIIVTIALLRDFTFLKFTCTIFFVQKKNYIAMIAVISEKFEKWVSVRVPLRMMENESDTNGRGCLLHKLEK